MCLGTQAFSDEKFNKISSEIDFLEIIDGYTLVRPLIKLVVQNDGSISGKAAFRSVHGKWFWVYISMIYGHFTLEKGYWSVCLDNQFSKFSAKLVNLYITTFRYDEWEKFAEDLQVSSTFI